MEHRKRKRGSVIFDPYYKVQTYKNMVWIDVQKRYTSADEALKDYPPNSDTRIVEITMGGRRII